MILENLTTFKYANYGFALLGLVIEKISGLPYAEYVTKNILKPLGLRNTHPDYRPEIRNIATGYGAEVPDEKRIVFGHYAANAYAPATGFVSNALDMTKFISTFSLQGNPRRVIGRESIKEMSRLHAKVDDSDEYGLGLDIYYAGDRKVIGHGGGFNGFTTRTILDTKDDIAIVVLTNSFTSAGPLASGILDAIIALVDDSREYSASSKIVFSKYEGIYRGVWGDSVISRAGDILIDYDPQTSNPLKNSRRLMRASAPHTFTIKTKNHFGPYDEPAVFTNFKNSKAQKLIEAWMPLKRVV